MEWVGPVSSIQFFLTVHPLGPSTISEWVWCVSQNVLLHRFYGSVQKLCLNRFILTTSETKCAQSYSILYLESLFRLTS